MGAMRAKGLVVGLVIAVGLALVGCGKKPIKPHYEDQGITLDLPKLSEAFNSAGPELQGAVNQATMHIRYRQYVQGLAVLDKLAKDPSLTDPQKKVVNDVIGQLQQVINKAPPEPPAAKP